MLRKLVRFSIINILILLEKKTSLENGLDKCVFFSIFQELGTLWDFHLKNHFKGFIGRESSWPISCLNDSENQEKGTLVVKIQKISQWSMPLDPLIGMCLWHLLRKLVCLSIYPRFAPVLVTLHTTYSLFHKGCFDSLWELAIGHWAFVHTELNANDLLERLLNNSFPMPNYQCPKYPLLNKLHIEHQW